MEHLHSPEAASAWLRARVTGRLGVDSRAVRPGDGFIAWPGAATDGRRFVGNALAQGASACLVEAQGLEQALDPSLLCDARHQAIASYPNLKADTGRIASAYFGEPTQQLPAIAITGTNGKTSTAWWIACAFPRLPEPRASRCLLVGTLGIGEPPRVNATGLTTPDPVRLHEAFREAVDAGVGRCVMEASSIGLEEHRLDGVRIDTAAFTNFTQDHLDYHGSMAAYWQAKCRLFDWPGLRHAVINIDDAHGAELAHCLQPRANACALDLWTVGRFGQARLRAEAVEHTDRGMSMQLVLLSGERQHVHTGQFGEFNADNLLVVAGCLLAQGVTLPEVALALQALPPVPGRLQRVPGTQGPLVLVDYAHTPDALEKALQAVRPLTARRGGELWCVFGCGGNRDAGKRPLMGAKAERHADRVLVTSDNPRDEDPAAIVAAIEAGMKKAHAREIDRGEAIRRAIASARATDVVLIAGKGHEVYQEVRGQRHPFSDVEVAAAALQAWGGAQ